MKLTINIGHGGEFRAQKQELEQMEKFQRNRKITKLVTKRDLPSQASAEFANICEFVQFSMGIPGRIYDFPTNPAQDEEKFQLNWVKNHSKHIKNHLGKFEYELKDKTISECKILLKQEISSISESLKPPESLPSCDLINNKLRVSLIEQHACEKECQLVGLRCITFNWASAFNSYSWNASMVEIIEKHFFVWSQTQPELNIKKRDKLIAMLEHWVNGRGKGIKKLSWACQSTEELQIHKAKR
ncbi:hypothetical protein O181_072363 [Austropuccinia psidii MF-1]|uniref:Uncharacterized protein n=1 Tax=Austropuccinia psidii MF-1 TaxID=1389203 RepID=A0A9Q3F7B3_9BASI|nr:hypothetical protein [Austropuccinia psidii MF-1]